MSTPVLITFEPVSRFYFGTSQSFAESFNPKSSRFPTQTTILGCLRHTMLKQAGLLDKDGKYPNKAKEIEVHNLTGKSKMLNLLDTVEKNRKEEGAVFSTSSDSTGYGYDFGKLIKISPVFMVETYPANHIPAAFYLPTPENTIEVKERSGLYPKVVIKKVLYYKVNNVLVFNNNGDRSCSFINNEYHKTTAAKCLGGARFWDDFIAGKEYFYDDLLNYDEVFIDDAQTGIGRDKSNRITVNEKYYYKNDFRLKRNYSFGVIAHFAETGLIGDEDVVLGGERSLFRLKVMNIGNNDISLFGSHPVIKRFLNLEDNGDTEAEVGSGLCLISSFFNNNKLDGYDYAIIPYVYSPRTTSMHRPKTDSFNMIPIGSVIFPNERYINNYQNNMLSKIGFNWSIKFLGGYKYE